VLAVALAVIAGVSGTGLAGSHGVSTTLPQDWHVVKRQLEGDCDPAQRLALATYRVPSTGSPIASIPRNQVLVIVLEDHVNSRSGYRPKPRRVSLPWARRSRFEGCCGLPTAPGWEVSFRSGGRDLMVFVHAGPKLRAPRRAQILHVLENIRG
jgi:hypothetical protein